MELIAAIDLIGGRGVRLREGDYDRRIADAEPLELARSFASAGIPRLHLVDLEGARAGAPRQQELLAAVAAAAREAAPGIAIQAGGGLRTPEAVGALLECGIDAAVIGTAGLTQPGFLGACARRWPGQMLASLDLRDGRPATDGWVRTNADDPLAAGERLLEEGAAALLVTDTRRDGTLRGPNLSVLAAFRSAFPSARLVAAGGIGSVADLKALEGCGMDGAILGLALLTGDVQLPEALAALATTEVSP